MAPGMPSPTFRYLLVALLLAGCSVRQSAPEYVWLKTDGTTPTDEEISREAEQCRAGLESSGTDPTGRFAHVEWAVAVLECMEQKGFRRVPKSESKE